ncbi:hypothetical protein QAD02_009828 [Eretmocerus hayati]|uniref:Uncharacterized protein n=1 Tax=Eretmocerus hayati TaxID=131215 RepID=A0ACC2NAI2_9HYME|nr:hypothetical protein QAD02_009828 [Eretmocerus hayati]
MLKKMIVRENFWYDDLPLPPIAVASTNFLPGGACKRQLNLYLQNLRKGTLWAATMFDASVKVPSGIIDGQTWQLGNFDQCYKLKMNLPNDNCKQEDMQGKYCLVEYKYGQRNFTTKTPSKLNLNFKLDESFWYAIEDRRDFRRIKRNILRIAICVPASCSAEDIQKTIQGSFGYFSQKYDLEVDVNVKEEDCQTSGKEHRFTTGAMIYGFILFLIVSLVIFATYFDGPANGVDNSETIQLDLNEILMCFSLRRNVSKLMEIHYNHRGLDILHFHRLVFLTLIMAGHAWLRYYVNPVRNKSFLELATENPFLIVIFNGSIMVDGFLAVGGLLTSYTLLCYLEKVKRSNFIILILFRFLRLTPLYAFVVFFYAYIFPLLGSGPLWPSIINAQADYCASTWWSNLFYLNNYVSSNQLCIFQSWYISVDFHCYILTIGLVSIFRRLPRKFGYSFLSLVTIMSIFIPFYMTYVRHLPPAFLPLPRTLTNLSVDKLFRDFYQKTHLRMSGYLVGVIAGSLLYDYRNVSWKISKRYSGILFSVSFITLVIGPWMLAYPYMNPNIKQSWFQMGLYAGLHRAVFATGICSAVLIISMSEGLDSLYKFLTPGWIQPLSRLTYGVFLSHNIIQSYHMGSVREEGIISPFMMMWNLIPDLILAYLIAFFIAMGIEYPFRTMEKYFIPKKQLGPSKEKAG